MLTGTEMASRLSYFLLDTTPSEALLDRAEAGALPRCGERRSPSSTTRPSTLVLCYGEARRLGGGTLEQRVVGHQGLRPSGGYGPTRRRLEGYFFPAFG